MELGQFLNDNATYTSNGYVFRTLYTLDARGKTRVWTLHITFRLGNKIVPAPAVITDEPDAGTIGEIHTVSGIEGGNLIESQPTRVMEGKNLNRANSTTVITQTISQARSDYQRYIKRGYVDNADKLSAPNREVSIPQLVAENNNGTYPWRLNAMLLKKLVVDTSDRSWNMVKFPCYVQLKLDGFLCTMVYHPEIKLSNEHAADLTQSQYWQAGSMAERLQTLYGDNYPRVQNIDKYSRGKETIFSCGHINLVYALVAQRYPGLYIVGELYEHGTPLQDISSIVNKGPDNAMHDRLEYYVFDCYYIEKPHEPFSTRIKLLKEVVTEMKNEFNKLNTNLVMPIKLVPSTLYHSADKIVEKLEQVKTEYEGLVVRNTKSEYEWRVSTQKRSSDTLKLKPRSDDEWPVVGYGCGKDGKDEFAIIWICAVTNTEEPLKKRETFKVVPNKPLALRKQLYTFLLQNPHIFQSRIYGQPLTIEYSELSSEGKPLQPKAIRFRDTAIDVLLEGKINGSNEEVTDSINNPLLLSSVQRLADTHPDICAIFHKYIAGFNLRDSDTLLTNLDTGGLISAVFNKLRDTAVKRGEAPPPPTNAVTSDTYNLIERVADELGHTPALYCTGFYDAPDTVVDFLKARFKGVDVWTHNQPDPFKQLTTDKPYGVIILNHALQKINSHRAYNNIRNYLVDGGLLVVIEQNSYTTYSDIEAVYKITDIIRYITAYINRVSPAQANYSDFVQEYRLIPTPNYLPSEGVIEDLRSIHLVSETIPSEYTLNNIYTLVFKKIENRV